MDEPGQSGQRRRLFLIKADNGTDRLIRLLGPFAAQSARITEIRLRGRASPARVNRSSSRPSVSVKNGPP